MEAPRRQFSVVWLILPFKLRSVAMPLRVWALLIVCWLAERCARFSGCLPQSIGHEPTVPRGLKFHRNSGLARVNNQLRRRGRRSRETLHVPHHGVIPWSSRKGSTHPVVTPAATTPCLEPSHGACPRARDDSTHPVEHLARTTEALDRWCAASDTVHRVGPRWRSRARRGSLRRSRARRRWCCPTRCEDKNSGSCSLRGDGP